MANLAPCRLVMIAAILIADNPLPVGRLATLAIGRQPLTCNCTRKIRLTWKGAWRRLRNLEVLEQLLLSLLLISQQSTGLETIR